MDKSTSSESQKWVGIDLHVHTPASEDYQGSREQSEYLGILERANEFEAADTSSAKIRAKTDTRPIGCLAFTDHNSVDGFNAWKKLYDGTVALAEAVRDKDPNNSLLQRLDADLKTLRSVRVLMGLELNAYPGVHLLLVFHESVKPEAAQSFLELVYGKDYEEFKGRPGPITTAPIEELLDLIAQTFGDQVMVIAPHVESGGGLYEVLKDLHQILMPVMKHNALNALSFNKAETRDKIRGLLKQPQYARSRPIALIQSSDSHGNRGSVGQPRTEVKISGHPTFTKIREAFACGRLKCSVDFVNEEYDRLVEGEIVRKFTGSESGTTFRTEDHAELIKFFCAALNSGTGVAQLDLSINAQQDLSHFYPEPIRQELAAILEAGLEPTKPPVFTRALLLSATRIRILFKPLSMNRLYTAGGIVYVLDAGTERPARATEIETRVAELMDSRFGKRFKKTLERVSEQSILLSKMPEGIPLFLRARERLFFPNLRDIGSTRIESAASRGRELAEEVTQLYNRKLDESPFGLQRGNTSILVRNETRYKEHYTRYSCFTTELDKDLAERLAVTRIENPSIVVVSGGAAVLCDPGYVVADASAVRFELPQELQKYTDACLGWLKSSFFIWYCAVHLSQKDLYQQLQRPGVKLPFPKLEYEDFYRHLGGLVRNVVIEEKRFLDEVQKQMSRGCDSRQKEKLRTRHNKSLDGLCLSIDQEIYDVLHLRTDEVEFVSRSISDMGLTDFGMLEHLEEKRADNRDNSSS